MDWETISTETWQISLPPDWVAKEGGQGGHYEFESPDGAKGVSIGTWMVGRAGTGRSSRDVAESFRSTTRASLLAMPGYAWDILVDELVEMGALSIALSDAWAREQSYRITGVVLARPPIIVRAAFHDYLCGNLEASRAYFAPIMESLQLAGQVDP